MGALRLNLGCGERPMPREDGWVNIDLHLSEKVDRVCDITKLDYALGSVDEILLSHVVEHIHPDDWPGALIEWVALLKSGGRITIECPDLQKVCEGFAHDTGGLRWSWWHKVLYGPDRRPGQAHLQGFTIPRMVAELRQAGLDVVRARAWGDNHDREDPTRTAFDLPSYNMRVEAVKP